MNIVSFLTSLLGAAIFPCCACLPATPTIVRRQLDSEFEPSSPMAMAKGKAPVSLRRPEQTMDMLVVDNGATPRYTGTYEDPTQHRIREHVTATRSSEDERRSPDGSTIFRPCGQGLCVEKINKGGAATSKPSVSAAPRKISDSAWKDETIAERVAKATPEYAPQYQPELVALNTDSSERRYTSVAHTQDLVNNDETPQAAGAKAAVVKVAAERAAAKKTAAKKAAEIAKENKMRAAKALASKAAAEVVAVKAVEEPIHDATTLVREYVPPDVEESKHAPQLRRTEVHDEVVDASSASEPQYGAPFAKAPLIEPSHHWHDASVEIPQGELGRTEMSAQGAGMASDAVVASSTKPAMTVISKMFSAATDEASARSKTKSGTLSTLEELARDLNTTKEVLLTLHKQERNIPQVVRDFAHVIKPFTLTEGHILQDSTQAQQYALHAQQPGVNTICETGFNAGHSALLFLLSNPTAHVYSFDTGKYPVALPAMQFLAKRFPERFTPVRGDSQKTMPSFRAQNLGVRCDLSVVDGGRVPPWVNTDLLNFWHMAVGPQSMIIMNETPCGASWCAGPTAAWHAMTLAGAIRPATAVQRNKFHGYSVGYFAKAPGSAVLATPPVAWPAEQRRTG